MEIICKFKRVFNSYVSIVLILSFILMVIVCAVLLSIGLEYLAEIIAAVAYFALVAGVIMSIFNFRGRKVHSK